MLSDLGPIIRGDKSILDHDLTHATSGLALYPAFDTGWREGDVVIAPERVTITRHSGGSDAGWSFYATGESKLRYYVTHLRWNRVPVGRVVEKGGQLGTVGNFVGARVPHVHVGINVELLLGAGAQLKHNTNYTHGQPTVREQLRALLEEEDVGVARDRILELRKAAFVFDAGGRASGTGPGSLDEDEKAAYFNVLLGIDHGRKPIPGLEQKIADLEANLGDASAAVALVSALKTALE